MKHIRLFITGKKGSDKEEAATYLAHAYGAMLWHRSELMQRITLAVVDRVGDLDGLLRQLFPDDDDVREAVRDDLFRWAAVDVDPRSPRRQLLQKVTDIVMAHEPDVFERELSARIHAVEKASGKKQLFIVINDVRSKVAYDYFKNQGFISLRIDVSPEFQRQRLIARDGYIPAVETLTHPSEVELDDVKHDYHVENNHMSKQHLHTALDDIVRQVFAS